MAAYGEIPMAAVTRDPQRSARAQAGGQITPQRTSALHIEGLVDRFVRDTHRLIIREVQPQPGRDLLWTPGPRPTAVLATAVTPADPHHLGTVHGDTVRALHSAGQPILRILPQPQRSWSVSRAWDGAIVKCCG